MSGVSFATTLMSEAEIPKKGRRKNKSPECTSGADNEAFVINREEPFMEAEPIRQEGKEQQYEALQQTDTFTPLEEKAEEDLQNQKNTSGRKNKKEDSQAVARETQNVADAVRIEEQEGTSCLSYTSDQSSEKRKESRWRFRCTSASYGA